MDRAINLDHDDPILDVEEYRTHHLTIFGHLPQPGENGKCQHPVHDKIRRAMNGATYRIDFDPREIVSDDSHAQMKYDLIYQLKYQEAKDTIREIEEEEEYDRLRKLGIITAR
jgi:hypothetical protein